MYGMQNVAAEDTDPAGESENRYQSTAAAKHDGRSVNGGSDDDDDAALGERRVFPLRM